MAPLLVNGRVVDVTGPFVVVYEGEQKVREFKSKEEAERFVRDLIANSPPANQSFIPSSTIK
jgi:hypothetical protein